MALTAYSVISLVIGFLATISAGLDPPLDAQHEASGPHVLRRTSAPFVEALPRPPQPANVVTLATPL